MEKKTNLLLIVVIVLLLVNIAVTFKPYQFIETRKLNSLPLPFVIRCNVYTGSTELLPVD